MSTHFWHHKTVWLKLQFLPFSAVLQLQTPPWLARTTPEAGRGLFEHAHFTDGQELLNIRRVGRTAGPPSPQGGGMERSSLVSGKAVP